MDMIMKNEAFVYPKFCVKNTIFLTPLSENGGL
jgi:hypothetical protein